MANISSDADMVRLALYYLTVHLRFTTQIRAFLFFLLLESEVFWGHGICRGLRTHEALFGAEG